MSKRYHAKEELVDMGTGATRSKIDTAYHMVPREGLDAIARRFALGAEKHGEGNWKLGMPWDVMWDHVFAHMMRLRDRLERGERFDPDAHDDDIGAIAWGMCAMAYFERSPDVTLTVREVFYGKPEPLPEGTEL